MAHYAYIYFRNVESGRESAAGSQDSRIEIVVPTGACGNITGKSYFGDIYLKIMRLHSIWR